MQVLQEVKLTRLVLAVVFTVLLADTLPHPNLSPGILAHSLAWMQPEPEAEQAATALVQTEPEMAE